MELLKIRTAQFEGPLDLLLFLIQKNELDISTISLHKITDQYVQYVTLMQEFNFDIASEFLLMAATLIYFKSKRLLPAEETAHTQTDDDMPLNEQELVRRLLEYKKFQHVGKELLSLPRLDVDVFPRPHVLPPEKQTIWKELEVTELVLCFQDALKRSRRRTKVIIRDPVSIPERIQTLGKILSVGAMTEFSSILSPDAERTEVVGTFVAILELSRLKKLKIYQNQIFGSIYLTLTEELQDFDPTLATGFQYKASQRIGELAIHGT